MIHEKMKISRDKNHKKRKILDLRNTVSEVKTPIESFNDRFNQEESTNSKFKII
jgi:hypothetical protein